MAVRGVELCADVFSTCYAYALCTEREEVMAMLIGEELSTGVVRISAVKIVHRSDKRPDRVEISPEQLTAAATYAEHLSCKEGRTLTIIGWFHSHPHITVWPSHIDVETQFTYQAMDKRFVGVIISLFNDDKRTKTHQNQITCFQAAQIGSRLERVEIPLEIVHVPSLSQSCCDALPELLTILEKEQSEAYLQSVNRDSSELSLFGRLRDAAMYTKNMSSMLELVAVPLITMLETRVKVRSRRLEQLRLLAQKKADEDNKQLLLDL